MQAGRGCGDRAGVTGVAGLIAFAVLLPVAFVRPRDIGRKGHAAAVGQHLFQPLSGRKPEPHAGSAVLVQGGHLGLQRRAKGKPGPNPRPLGAFQKRPRRGAVFALPGSLLCLRKSQEKEFYPAAAGLAAQKSGRKDPGIVQGQDITRSEQAGQVVKTPVLYI